jgi:hypothetical protein
MKNAFACLFAITVLGLLLNDSFAASQARVTLKIVDDEGVPMVDYPVNAGFYGGENFNGRTDTNGFFSFEGKAVINEANWVLQKEGYYYSHGTYVLGGAVKDAKLQPWDPVVTTVVRRIINPIPMYAKTVETKIPATNVPYGFDLQVGDWVRPTGNGGISDLVFKIEGYWTNFRENDSSLTVSFARPNDGLKSFDYEIIRGKPAGSAFILPRIAPESGYGKEWKWERARKNGDATQRDQILDDLKDGRSYVFRSRSETNEIGTVTNALYGKIRGNFEFIGASTKKGGSWLKFTYYLNPTPNDRNLEFDPKRNLFKKLGEFEEVSDP